MSYALLIISSFMLEYKYFAQKDIRTFENMIYKIPKFWKYRYWFSSTLLEGWKLGLQLERVQVFNHLFCLVNKEVLFGSVSLNLLKIGEGDCRELIICTKTAIINVNKGLYSCDFIFSKLQFEESYLKICKILYCYLLPLIYNLLTSLCGKRVLLQGEILLTQILYF